MRTCFSKLRLLACRDSTVRRDVTRLNDKYYTRHWSHRMMLPSTCRVHANSTLAVSPKTLRVLRCFVMGVVTSDTFEPHVAVWTFWLIFMIEACLLSRIRRNVLLDATNSQLYIIKSQSIKEVPMRARIADILKSLPSSIKILIHCNIVTFIVIIQSHIIMLLRI